MLNTKSWKLALPGLMMGTGKMDEMSSVLNAHLVTVSLLLEFLERHFMQPQNLSSSSKGRRYLNTWYCSYFGIHVICIELCDSVS